MCQDAPYLYLAINVKQELLVFVNFFFFMCQVAPYLYLAINVKQELLVFVIGLGVGVAALLGTLRFVNGWSLKPLIYGSMVPCILLAMYMHWYVCMYTCVCVCV